MRLAILISVLVSSVPDMQVAAVDMISSGNYLVTKLYTNNQCSGSPDSMTLTPAGASLQTCVAGAVQTCTQDSNMYKKQSCTSDLALLAQYEYPNVDVKQLQQYTDYTCRELKYIAMRAVNGEEIYTSECGFGSTAYLRSTATPKTSTPATSAPAATNQAASKLLGIAVMAFGLAMTLALV